MLTRPIPKSAKLGLIGITAIAIIGLVLLPMEASTPGSPGLVIKGTVTDAVTGEPIAGVKVFDDGYANDPNWEKIESGYYEPSLPHWGDITDAKGNYAFLTYPEHHSFKIEATGYKTKRATLYSGHFTINKKDEEIFDFELEPVESQKTGKFIKTLGNGVTIELVGTCQYADDGAHCYRPDGEPLGRKLTIAKWNQEPKAGDTGIILKLSGPEDLSFSYDTIEGTKGWEGSCSVLDENGEKLEEYEAAMTRFDNEQKTTTAKFGGAAGPWKTIANHDGKSMGIDSGISFTKATKTEKGIQIYTTDILGRSVTQRIIAIDNKSKLHPWKAHTGSVSNSRIRQSIGTFPDLKLEQIKEFQFQTRPYEWVTFKNVSLKPDFKTVVQVEGEGFLTLESLSVPYGASGRVKAALETIETSMAYIHNAEKDEIIELAEYFDLINESCDDLQGKNNSSPPAPRDWGTLDSEKVFNVLAQLSRIEGTAEGCRELARDNHRELFENHWKTLTEQYNQLCISLQSSSISKEDSEVVIQAADLGASAARRVELSYDDGRSDGQKSIAGSGHGVIFDAPGDGYVLKTVRIFGSRYGQDNPPNEDFHIYVCDENFEIIKDLPFPYGRFTKSDPKWVTLRIEPVEVPSTFVLCAGFNPERTKGVYVHFDSSSSGNSLTGLPGRELEPFNEGEWMIRASLEKLSTDEADSKRLQEPKAKAQTASVSDADKRASEELSSSGWKLWGQRKLAEAEEQFKKAVEKNPANANAWNGLGWSQTNQEKVENATLSFEKCLEIEPKHSAALNGLGWIAKGKGEVDEAIGYWEKAVQALPSATAALNGLGQTYMELEQYDKAAKYYQMWLNVEPDNTNAKTGLEKAKSQIQPGIIKATEDLNLQELINSARAGDTVNVPEGTYTKPIIINKSLTLKGQPQSASILQVTADMPAIMVDTKGKGNVTIEGITIKWQLATSDEAEHRYAVGVKDTKAEIKNCVFHPLGNSQRSPVAVNALGFSNLTISGCRFEGFDYVISYREGTEGKVEDCLIMDCGHQGVISYQGSTLRVERNVITGSKYHAVRTTGGTIFVKDNLLISNANRGIYLGNKSGKGTISNNVIMKNGTGVDGFASSNFKIENNVIGNNTYAGIGMRNTTSLTIRNNILMSNQRGLVLFEPDGTSKNKIYMNTYWKNENDAENVTKTPDSLDTNPGFTNPENGDFSLKDSPLKEQKQGLTNSEIFKQLWNKWKGLADPGETTAVSSISAPTPEKTSLPDEGSVPIVISTVPAVFSDDVSTILRRITVTFDQPMMDGSWSWTGGGDTYPETTGQIRYDRNKTTCILPVRLAPGRVYWVGINSPSYKNFKNLANVPAQRYVILFSTEAVDGKPTPIPDDMINKAREINERASENLIVPKLTGSEDTKQTYIVEFVPIGSFRPGTAKELLDAFNQTVNFRVNTHHFKTRVEKGKLRGYILTDSMAEQKALNIIMDRSDNLKFVSGKEITENELAEHYAMGRPGLDGEPQERKSSDYSSVLMAGGVLEDKNTKDHAKAAVLIECKMLKGGPVLINKFGFDDTAEVLPLVLSQSEGDKLFEEIGSTSFATVLASPKIMVLDGDSAAV
ncbi:MAG: right-handed parallel beta-helix repeat-containing protein, partial [Planctomycetota bacterium]